MVHLPVHLAHEAKLGGPVQYRNMYLAERYLRTLKSYVRNKNHPEGAIAEGYIADKSLTFCSRYLKNIPTKFNKPGRNDDGSVSNAEMSIFKKTGQTKRASDGKPLPRDEFKQACMHVLQNCEDVSQYMEEYKREIEGQDSMRADTNEFLDWFRARIFHLAAQGGSNDELISLAVHHWCIDIQYLW